jgi:hypothetical protein
MRTVYQMLVANECAPLNALGEIWGFKLPRRDDSPERAMRMIGEVMLTPANVDRVWAMLSDAERGALHTLLGARGGSVMVDKLFMALHGGIRDLGEGGIDREKPHLEPQTVTEGLFFRGLVGRAYETNPPRRVFYVPSDLIGLLIGMKTSYHDLPDDGGALPIETEDEPLSVEILPDRTATQPADTALVDDLTTLLAYIRLRAPALTPPADGMSLESRALTEPAVLSPHLLHDNPARAAFLFAVGAAADLITVQADRAYLEQARARRWLGLPRGEQVRELFEAWRANPRLLDLASVPGLRVDRRAGGIADSSAALGRVAALDLLTRYPPRDAWWDIDSFIHVVRQQHSAFLRPNGDFQSWYIFSEGGTDRMGVQHWDSVDGAYLEYLIAGPLHWLGLVDLSEDAARFTAYGRGALNVAAYPKPSEVGDKIGVADDGTLTVSRKVARADRFTVARFASWIASADLRANLPYTYRIDRGSLRRAADEGITPTQIGAFLARTVDGAIPPSVTKLLEMAQLAPTMAVTLEQAIIVRVTAKEALDYLYATPELRRYLGARLGDLAAIVRGDQVADVHAALDAQGIEVTWLGDS